MDTTKDGGPAFPFKGETVPGSPGMSLRDWFAGQALAGIMASRETALAIYADRGELYPDEAIAEEAFNLADALLRARSKE